MTAPPVPSGPGLPAAESPYYVDLTPADGFSAETDLLQTTATAWLELSASLAKVGMNVSDGLGHADDFGYIDLAPNVGARFENYVTRLVQLLTTGADTARIIGANLSATATAYDAVDQRAKDTMPGAGG